MISRRDGVDYVRSMGRILRAAALGLTTVGLAAVLVIPTTVPATADPPLTVAEAKARIDQLETDAAAIDQDYVGVREQINQGKSKLKVKQADVKAQTARVKRLKHQVGQVALAQFQNRNLDTAAQLFVTQDTEGFLSQISTVEKVSENQNLALQNYQLEQANLADLELSAETDLAALAEQEKQLKALRTRVGQEDRRVQGRAGQAHRGGAAADRRRRASSDAGGAERCRAGRRRQRPQHSRRPAMCRPRPVAAAEAPRPWLSPRLSSVSPTALARPDPTRTTVPA